VRYELTQEQYDRLMEASRPVMYIVACGTEPTSPRENAERVWREVANEHGCRYDTIQPYHGMGPRFFTAEPQETRHDRIPEPRTD
jgi:hypothetical protein